MRGPLDPPEEDLRREVVAADLQRREEMDDLKWLMAHAQGRRIVTRLFDRTGIRRTSFNANGSTMAFNEGRRDIGLWIEREVFDAAPEAYLRLLKECIT